MSKKTLALIGILFILTVVLVVVALTTKKTLPTSPATTSQTPTATPTIIPGRTVLSLSPDPVIITPSTTSASVDVLINTNGDETRAVQLEIAYDPKAITNVRITPGTFFTNAQQLPFGGVNIQTGRISYALAPGAVAEGVKGTGTVATITFTPLLSQSNPSTTIELLDKSLVSGNEPGQNVLVKTMSSVIRINTDQTKNP